MKIKRSIASAASGLILFTGAVSGAAVSTATSASASTTTSATVKSGIVLNVRTSPSVSAPLAGSLAGGSHITGTQMGSWFKITSGAYSGKYVSSTWLSTSTTSTSSSSVTGKVTPGIVLNVRTSPSTSSSVAGTLSGGSSVTGTVSNGWMHLTSGQYSGKYVSTDYVQIDGSTTPPPSTGSSTTPSTGEHANEAVVATAANQSVPNHFATGFPTVQAGSDANNIRAVEYLLADQGITTDNSSSYDASVTAGVKKFQAAQKLSQTGIADPTTLSKLTTTFRYGQSKNAGLAAEYLLSKHGYTWNSNSSPAMTKSYGADLNVQVQAFQTGHGIVATSKYTYIGNHTWATLFSNKTSGPIYPLMQAGTGGASQWNNCGPASASMITLYLNKNLPYWHGSAATRNDAVSYMRYTLMGVAHGTYNDQNVGTTPSNIIPAFAKLGINSFSSNTSAVINAAKAGHPSIAGGDGNKLSWNQDRSDTHIFGPASHYIAVLGWDGTNFIVGDPIVTPSHNVVHTLSEAQLRNFGATAPGWGPNVPGNDVPPSKNNIITR